MAVLEFGHLLRQLYLGKRFGRLSPLTLLRVEVSGFSAECDWLMQSRCAWDLDRPHHERVRNASLQAIEDALAVRKLLFCVLPGVDCALLRVYRRALRGHLELVVAGDVRRKQRISSRIRSPAMKAKLYGLQFQLGEEGFEALGKESEPDPAISAFFANAEISMNGGT